MFGDIAKTISGIVGKMTLPGGVMGAMSRALSGGVDQRQAFVSLLLATATHANHKPNFNLELEINDLWTHLSVLKDQQSSGGGIGGVLQGVTGGLGGGGSMFNEGITKAIEGLLKSK